MDPYSSAIEESLLSLFPGITLKKYQVPTTNFRAEYGDKLDRGKFRSGVMEDGKIVRLWYPNSPQLTSIFEVQRPRVSLTRAELKLCSRFPEILDAVLPETDNESPDRAQRIAVQLALSDLVVARFLRRGNTSRNWTPAQALGLLKNLTFERYEGQPCTSGFVYTSQVDEYISHIDSARYEVVAFEAPINLSPMFFAKPASYRYVDGHNSIYLLGREGIYGAIKLRNPKDFSIIDRCNQLHLRGLVEKMPGRVWLAHVDLGDVVNVLQSGGVQLVWAKNRWRIRNGQILRDVFCEAGVPDLLAEALCSVVFTLSTLKMGAVLLVTADDMVRPKVVRRIDDSALGDATLGLVKGRQLADLIHQHSALGVLSSDGLTTISKQGTVVSCGDVIDLSNSKTRAASGASGSQAAAAASSFGVAVKVSQDGPISVFSAGELLMRL